MARVLVLTAVTGSQIGKYYTVAARSTTIGSGGRSDLVLSDRAIEPRHAEIRQVLDRWFIVPLSTGGRGILLNGLPVSGQSRINPGDLLTLGSVMYRVGVTDMLEQEAGTQQRMSSGVPRIGEYFVRRGLMTNEQLNRIAQRQSELKRNGSQIAFGQVACEMGLLSRGQLESALAEQREDFYQRMSG